MYTILIITTLAYAQQCYSHSDCTTGCCYNEACTTADSCNTLPYRSPCDSNSTCSSYSCIGNVCQYSSSGRCINHTQCLSSYCNNGYCGISSMASLVSNENLCYTHSQCQSSNCTNYLCKPYQGAEQCSSHSECKLKNDAYGCCINSTCAFASYCIILQKSSICTYDYECASMKCNNGRCTDPEQVNFYLAAVGMPLFVAGMIGMSIVVTRILLNRKKGKVVSSIKYADKPYSIVHMMNVSIDVLFYAAHDHNRHIYAWRSERQLNDYG